MHSIHLLNLPAAPKYTPQTPKPPNPSYYFAGIFFLESPEGEQCIVILMGFASLGFFVVSFRTNKVQPILFINLAIM